MIITYICKPKNNTKNMKTLKLFLAVTAITLSGLFTISCGGSEKDENPFENHSKSKRFKKDSEVR